MNASTPVLPRWCSPAARLAAHAYGAVVDLRNARFDEGIGIRRVSRPVVSVGNIVAGGTGKSPVVRWIAQWALDREMIPLIALRGYRSKNGCSDEALEHQSLVPGARVAVGANRHKTIEAALARDSSARLVILDDGFQHRALARDLDLVLVDGSCSHLDGALLPLGYLRESPRALRRASAVIVTHSADVNVELDARIHALHGGAVLAWCAHEWEGLEIYRGAGHVQSESTPSAWLQNQRVALWAGVAKPAAIAAEVRACGADVVAFPALRDHAHYGPTRVGRLVAAAHEARATAIVLTTKDWVKVRVDSAAIDLPIVVPRLRLRFSHGETALCALLESAASKQ